MNKKINIRAVANAAGVSPATASRVLNGSPSVNAALTEKVLAAARDLGYRLASPRSGLTRHIVFIVPNLDATYYATVADGMIDTAAAQDLGVTVMITHSDPVKEIEYLRMACAASTAGIVFTPTTARNPYEAVPALRSLPLVITGPHLQLPGASNVYMDSFAAGYIGTRYLLRLGRRHIAFLGNYWRSHIHSFEDFMREADSPQRSFYSVYDRYDGFCRALSEEGLSHDPALTVFGGYSFEDGYDAARQLLASSVDFDAVLAPNDRVGAGVLRILREQGLRVPEQVSLLCLNGGVLSEMFSPSLTSVELDNYRMGEAAVEQVLNLLRGGEPAGVRIEARLNIRSSTAAVG